NDVCTQQLSCRLHQVRGGQGLNANFTRVDEKSVDVRVENQEPLISQSLWCISFPYRTSYCAFLGCLIDVDEPSEFVQTVTFSYPIQLTVSNLRREFRVPVSPDAGLNVTLKALGKPALRVQTVNITESGIEVELPQATTSFLEGSTVKLDIGFRG